MIGRPSILFLCRDNAGLSLMAEALAMHTQPQVRAFSAAVTGTAPVDIAALECLHAEGIPADGLSSKPVELFGLSGAPRVDLVVALVEDAHRGLRRLPWTHLLRVRTLGLDDVSRLADAHRRRLAYRRALPALRDAIAVLLEEEHPGLCGAAA